MQTIDATKWRTIEDFEDYVINEEGEIRNLTYKMRLVRPSVNNYNLLRVTLTDHKGERATRVVRNLVAQTFLCQPPISGLDTVLQKDLDPLNVSASNLEWRSRSYAIQYASQFNLVTPHQTDLKILETTTNTEFANVVEAAQTYGLLFRSIWESISTGEETWPTNHIFVISALNEYAKRV